MHYNFEHGPLEATKDARETLNCIKIHCNNILISWAVKDLYIQGGGLETTGPGFSKLKGQISRNM